MNLVGGLLGVSVSRSCLTGSRLAESKEGVAEVLLLREYEYVKLIESDLRSNLRRVGGREALCAGSSSIGLRKVEERWVVLQDSVLVAEYGCC